MCARHRPGFGAGGFGQPAPTPAFGGFGFGGFGGFGPSSQAAAPVGAFGTGDADGMAWGLCSGPSGLSCMDILRGMCGLLIGFVWCPAAAETQKKPRARTAAAFDASNLSLSWPENSPHLVDARDVHQRSGFGQPAPTPAFGGFGGFGGSGGFGQSAQAAGVQGFRPFGFFDGAFMVCVAFASSTRSTLTGVLGMFVVDQDLVAPAASPRMPLLLRQRRFRISRCQS